MDTAVIEVRSTIESSEIPDVKHKETVTEGDLKDTIVGKDSSRPRRRDHGFRRIPRTTDVKDKKGAPRMNKGRSRTTSESSVASSRVQRRRGDRRRAHSDASNISESTEASPMSKLRSTVLEKYEKKGLNLFNSYVKNYMEFAKFDNTTNFLQRCEVMQLIPSKYRLANHYIKNTRHVIRTLERFSHLIMQTDLKYNRKRRFQVEKLLDEKRNRMKEMFGDELFTDVIKISQEAFEKRHSRIQDQQTKLFEQLLKEYDITAEEREEGEESLRRLKEREKSMEKSREERRAAEREQRLKKSAAAEENTQENGEGDSTAKDNAEKDGDKDANPDQVEETANEDQDAKKADA